MVIAALPRVCLALAVLLSACDDGAVTPTDTADPAAQEEEVQSTWLAADDPRRPGPWLAEMDLGPEPAPADYARYGALLSRAGVHYHETPRMIANRVAQLHAELAPSSPDLSIAMLLEDFAWEAGNARPQTLGEVAQHYLVLRRRGISHVEAMASVRAAYGAAPR